jgi:hypothetical protein
MDVFFCHDEPAAGYDNLAWEQRMLDTPDTVSSELRFLKHKAAAQPEPCNCEQRLYPSNFREW